METLPSMGHRPERFTEMARNRVVEDESEDQDTEEDGSAEWVHTPDPKEDGEEEWTPEVVADEDE